MLQRKKITSLIINAIVVKMLLTYPRNIILNSGNAAWIQVLYNIIVILLIFTLTASLYKSKKNIIDVAELCGGKTLKIIVGIITGAVLTVNYIPILKDFPETIQVILLQDIRLDIIMVVFVTISIIGAYMGIESIATVHYLFLPIAGIVMLSFLLLLIPYYDLDNLFPILGNGTKSIMLNGMNSISVFSDIILLNLLLPYMENYGEMKTIGFRSIIIGGAVTVFIMLSYCAVYPYPQSESFVFPVYQLTRVIHLSSFFSRFETFLQFIWSILMLLYSSFYLYIISSVWQTTFNLKFNKPLIVPIAICIFGLAASQGPIIDSSNLFNIINYIAYPFAFLLPVIFGAALRKVNKHEKL